MTVCIVHVRKIAKFAMTVMCYNDIHVLFYHNVIFAGTLINDYSTNAKIR